MDVGVFTVPPSLESYAKDLLENHADIGTGNSPIHYMNVMAFIVLCCPLATMDATSFSEVTESLILKWRDAIRGALHLGFKADFLMDHLKSVARASLAITCDESKELKVIDDNITAIEKLMDSLKIRREKICNNSNTELRKTCETEAAKFPGKTCGYFSN
ncbi:uncharacterized protein [Rutidosis leptorrhynchoides]|uniref:uncharacterized protein n=1 Tax=Rutidosis leptorrhynchoides TaxID=125765 RepID=UPI003A9A5FEA